MEWNVLKYDINKDSVISFNVFHNISFRDCAIACSQKADTFEEFSELLKREVRYYFWSRCEYEILVSSHSQSKQALRVDIAQQLEMNWEPFSRYTYDRLKEILY